MALDIKAVLRGKALKCFEEKAICPKTGSGDHKCEDLRD
jgi:hypothetical protein